MKHVTRFGIFLLFLLPFTSVTAQENDDELKTLFREDFKYSGFGGFLMDFSTLNGDLAFSNGGGGGILVNDKFFIGGFGQGTVNNLTYNYSDGSTSEIDLDFGGIWAGYHFKPMSAIHFAADLKLGWGELSINDYDGFGDYYGDNIFAINPGISAELNITSWMRIGVTGGYRLFMGTNNDFISDTDLSTPNVSTSFKFGWFQ